MPEQRRESQRRKKKVYTCVACGRTLGFCWSCACGFMMCTECMQENLWGMTCNNITWTCPDCGATRNFGNQ
ncbi:MAG: hypothetical protein AABY87_09225 [bacterium]